MKKILLIFCFATLGCRPYVGEQEDKNFRQLTLQEKTNFALFLDSVGHTQTAVQNARTLQRSSGLMTQAIRKSGCDVSWRPFQDHNPTGTYNVTLSASAGNSNCPISFRLQVQRSRSLSGEYFVSSDLNYSVRTTDFAQLNDIVGIEFKSQGQMRYDPTNRQPSGRLSGQGYINSQKYGLVKVGITGHIEGRSDFNQYRENQEFALTFDFPEYRVRLKKVATRSTSSGMNQEFYLNQDRIALQDFDHYLMRAGPVFSEGLLD